MKLYARRFIVSFFVTLMIITAAAGIYKVTSAGSTLLGIQNDNTATDYGMILKSGKAVDRAMGILWPEIRTAAHWFIAVCAAVSKLF